MKNNLQISKRKNEFKMKYFSTILIASIIFVSCKPNENKTKIESPYFTAFFKENNESILRDINFDMQPSEVKNIEKSKLYEATEDHLFYEFSFPTDSTEFSEYAEIQYIFDENNKLDVITSNIFLNDTIQEQKLTTSLTKHFENRYGKPESEDKKSTLWIGGFTNSKSRKTSNYKIRIKKIEKQTQEDLTGISVEYHLER